jgi:hypothetical protein
MTRTIEHIMATHEIASRRRAQGRRVWDREIPMKALLDEGDGDRSTARIADLAVRIAQLFKASLPVEFFEDPSGPHAEEFCDAIEEMLTWTAEGLERDQQDGIDCLAELNGHLSTIYDWADLNRVWLGP